MEGLPLALDKKKKIKKGEGKKEEGASDIYINPSSFF